MTTEIVGPDWNLAAWLGDSDERAAPDRLARELDRLFAGPDQSVLRRAQVRLEVALAPACYYDGISGTRLGNIFVAASERGLMAVNFGIPEAVFLASLKRGVKGRIVRSGEQTAEIRRQIVEYLDGTRSSFDLPIDWTIMTGFQRKVLEAALAIGRGRVATYGEIARKIGRPGASRAVGQALGHNPMPLVIPCHRVLGSDGSLRGYGGGGGIRTKAALLRLEGVNLG